LDRQAAVLADTTCRRQYLRDVYADTRTFTLLSDGVCLGKTEYTRKHADCGEVQSLATGVRRWMYSRFLFDVKIVRCGDDNEWIDFVTAENGSGQTVFDCVGTVRGSPADSSQTRCSSAFAVAQAFFPEVIKGQADVMRDRPDVWPAWHAPPPARTLTAAERADYLEWCAAVRDEELADELTID
jgi:hypothetical protein